MQNSQQNHPISSQPKKDLRVHGTRHKKEIFKTYNPLFHNFDYEQTQKQKNTFIEVYNEKSTPSDISQQSIFDHNSDIFQMIPALRELLDLAECSDEEMITEDEYTNMLLKLKVRQACAGLTGPSRYFDFRRNHHQIKLEEFVAFFTSDIQNIELNKYSLEELVLKLGLEIYRAVSKENTFLELRHLVNYIKDHKKLDIDMTNMLEIFDFFMDPNQGVLKSKTSLISFFNKNAGRLAKAMTNEFLRQLQNIQNKKLDDLGASRRDLNISEVDSKIPNVVKIYDSNAKNNHKNKPSLLNITNPLINNKENEIKIQTKKSLQINIENKNVLDIDSHFFNNFGISEVFQEILPKNRGWIMRKSNRHENKWSMVFLEVLENKLLSTKPTSLKRSINVRNLEIHKCNFLEVIKRLETQSGAHHKRADSFHKTPRTLETKADKERSDYLFFIVDKVNHKTYLIRSPDNTIIGSIIHFYMLKENPNKPEAQGLRPILNSDPEYSGIIEIAVCKKTCINRYHSSLKPYSFKKQFLIIKQGRFNIYEMKTKDNLNLLDYEAQINQNYDLFPQTNQFVFTLEKNQNPALHQLTIKSPQYSSNLATIQESDPHDGVIRTNEFISPRFNTEFHNNYEDLKVVEYKNSMSSSKGFFSNIFSKIQQSAIRKKNHKIVLACDTELKRRQWVLTLKFFSQLAQSSLFKSSFSKDSGISSQDDPLTSKNSFQNEINNTLGDTLPDQRSNKLKKKKQSSISFKQKPAYNPDFIDVYKSEDRETPRELNTERLQSQDIEVKVNNNSKKSLPLMTEPDASQRLDSEEVLMTFTQFNPDSFPFVMTKGNSLGNRIIENFEAEKLLFSNEIKSMSDLEIWQKFLIFFMQESHPCSEFDLTNDSMIEDTKFVSARDIEALEEDVKIRCVNISAFNTKRLS